MILSQNDEEVANCSKNIPNSRLECTNHTLFQTRMVEIDKKKHTLWRDTCLYSLYKGLTPSPPLGVKNALQIMSLAAYTSETKTNTLNSNSVPT